MKPQPRLRQCLGLNCGRWFMSKHSGNRKCPRCASKPAPPEFAKTVRVLGMDHKPADY
jgi:hypothetical protein